MPISAAGPVARPDLVVTSVSAPPTGTRGSSMSTSATVTNAGVAAAGFFYVQFYLPRDDASLSAEDVPYWFCNVGSLAPGASRSCSASFAVPAPIPAGTYHLVVRVDDGGAVYEAREDNNVATAGPITID